MEKFCEVTQYNPFPDAMLGFYIFSNICSLMVNESSDWIFTISFKS